MADSSTMVIGSGTATSPAPRRVGSLKKLARRRSTTALLLCAPLILLIVGLKIYPTFYAVFLSMLDRKMDELRRARQFHLPAHPPVLPAGDLPVLPVRDHRGDDEGDCWASSWRT